MSRLDGQFRMPTQVRLPYRFVLPVAALCALLGVAIAAAHARYDHSIPAQGAVVQTPPARVDIFTVQEMKKEQGADEITVTDASNNRVDSGDTAVDDNDRKHFSVGLKPNLAPGRYLVSFKNVSDEDGEADSGRFAFYVGTAPTAAQTAADAKLSITSKKDETAKSDSHTGLIITIIVIVLVVLAILIVAGLWYRRRRPRRRV